MNGEGGRRYLIWLNWDVGAFRLNARSEARFRELFGDAVDVARSREEFLEALPRATHAVVWEFEKEWFALAPRLKALATPGAGRELLPTDEEMPEGVVRINGSFHGAIMSETVVAMVFAHARGLYAAREFQRAGVLWPRGEMSPHCRMVAGTKAVILGYGKIGKATGDKLEALGVEVKGIGRKNIGELLPAVREADWVICVLPSDTGTDNLVGERVIGAMKREAVLINVGRGNAVDEAALAEALRRGRIGGAYLDVFAREPLDGGSPLAEDLPGLVRLPHASAFAPEYLEMFFVELAGVLRAGDESQACLI